MRRLKGVVISTETILLLASIVILAIFTLYGISSVIANQASSNKATLSINEASVRVFKSGNVCNFISVTVYVTNLGDKEIVIRDLRVVLNNGNVYNLGSINSVVNPGETKAVSKHRVITQCLPFPDGGNSTFVQVTYDTVGENRWLIAGKPAEVEVLG